MEELKSKDQDREKGATEQDSQKETGNTNIQGQLDIAIRMWLIRMPLDNATGMKQHPSTRAKTQQHSLA
jgi:hypothetical protein